MDEPTKPPSNPYALFGELVSDPGGTLQRYATQPYMPQVWALSVLWGVDRRLYRTMQTAADPEHLGGLPREFLSILVLGAALGFLQSVVGDSVAWVSNKFGHEVTGPQLHAVLAYASLPKLASLAASSIAFALVGTEFFLLDQSGLVSAYPAMAFVLLTNLVCGLTHLVWVVKGFSAVAQITGLRALGLWALGTVPVLVGILAFVFGAIWLGIL